MNLSGEHEPTLDLMESVKAFGTDRFEEVLATQVEEQSGDLPLDEMCQRGGYPDDVSDISVYDVDETDNEITVILTVPFTESVPSGCADITHEYSRIGAVTININKKTGKGRVTNVDAEEDDGEDDDYGYDRSSYV